MGGRHRGSGDSSGMGKAAGLLVVALIIIGVASWFLFQAVAP